MDATLGLPYSIQKLNRSGEAEIIKEEAGSYIKPRSMKQEARGAPVSVVLLPSLSTIHPSAMLFFHISHPLL